MQRFDRVRMELGHTEAFATRFKAVADLPHSEAEKGKKNDKYENRGSALDLLSENKINTYGREIQ